jgi:hypothetical protein
MTDRRSAGMRFSKPPSRGGVRPAYADGAVIFGSSVKRRGSLFALLTAEEPIMPTLMTTEHGEIHVHHREVTRMANLLWRLGSPERRTAYVEKARRRLAAGPARHSDAAIVLAAGDEKTPS